MPAAPNCRDQVAQVVQRGSILAILMVLCGALPALPALRTGPGSQAGAL